MKEKMKKIMPVIYITLILAIALFMSNQLNTNVISSIQGYRYSGRPATAPNATNGNATNSNATNSNVINHSTNSNATNGNATNGNATNGNATHSNATHTNAAVALTLNTFQLASGDVRVGDKVKVTIVTSGSVVSRGTVFFKNVDGTSGFSAPLDYDANRNVTITIPIAAGGTYQISEVILGGTTGSGITFSKTFTAKGDTGTTRFNFNSTLRVLSEEDAKKIANIESFSIDGNAEKGQMVPVTLKTDKTLKRASLVLKNANNQKVRLPIRSVNNNPYVETLATMEDGTYKVESLTLETSEAVTKYSTNPQDGEREYGFTQQITINGNSGNREYYNNEDLTDALVDQIKNSKEKKDIVINADYDSLVNENVFAAVKGQERNLVIAYDDHEMIFKGSNITDPKTISARIVTDEDENHEAIEDHVEPVAIIHFEDNGYLPGKARVKIAEDANVEKALNGNKANVYLYNPNSDKFVEIAKDVKLSKGSYSFDITHNSSYVMTTKTIDKELLEEDNGDVVAYLKDRNIYLILLIIGVIIILCAVVVVLILKNKNKGSKKEEVKEEKREEKETKEEKKEKEEPEEEKEDEEEKEKE